MTNYKLKVTSIGNSLGIILPKEAVAHLKVVKGDELSVVETVDGYEIKAHDEEFEKQMKVAREIMHRYRNALHELAK